MMNIRFGTDGDYTSHVDSSGGYEWWYFDVKQQDFACTIIFFRGMPMSPYYIESLPHGLPDNYCGFSISVYKNDKKIAGCIHHTNQLAYTSNDQGEISVYVNNCGFIRHKDGSYTITIDTHGQDLAKGISGSLRFTPSIYHHTHISQQNAEHEWRLIAPSCSVHGTITLSEYGEDICTESISSMGYHDCNHGEIPLYDSYKDWYWGRIHLNDQFTLVYYHYPSYLDTPAFTCMCIEDRTLQTLEMIHDTRITISKQKYNMFGLHPGSIISVEATYHHQKCTAIISHQKCIESGPFYMRYYSQCTATIQGIEIESNNGISEYFYAPALQSVFIRMMIKTPIALQNN